MEQRQRVFPPFTSALSRTETVLVLLWLPVHILLLPYLLRLAYDRGLIPVLWVNVVYYALGFVYMLLAGFRFLRRDFDALLDHPLLVTGQAAGGYLRILAYNMLAAGLIARFAPEAVNLNQSGVEELVDVSVGPMKAALVYLGPLTEEMMFRAGLFSTLRKRNRLLAYALSILAFSVYHVWGYAVQDASYWIFLLQYLPSGWLLARCYERTNTIWGSVFCHMLNNAMALALTMAMPG